ncbi:MAG: DnaJ domain-containing protein [Casimicrobiaceae bacterium]
MSGQQDGADLNVVADLLLRLHREPARYRAQVQRALEGWLDGAIVLILATRRVGPVTDPALAAPDLDVKLRDAAQFAIRQLFFREGATHYEVLGLRPDADAATLRQHFRLLMHLLHPDRQVGNSEWPASFAARANAAHAVLKSEDGRRDYDQRLPLVRSSGEAELPRVMPMPGAQAAFASRPVSQRRAPAARSRLPEWITAGVGGFVRAHPAATVFGVAILASAVVIWTVAVNDGDEPLTRDGIGFAQGDDHASHAAPSRLAALVQRPPAEVSPTRPRLPTRERGAAVAPVRMEAQREHRVAVVAPPTIRPPVGPASRASAMATHALMRAAEMHPVNAATSAPEREKPMRVAKASVDGMSAVVPTQASAQSRASKSAESAVSTPVPEFPPVMVARAQPPAAPVSEPARPSAAAVSEPARLTNADVEALMARFVSTYESGNLDAFAALFDKDAHTNILRGRAAIRREYDELFRLTSSRQMDVTRIRWQLEGDHAEATGELQVHIHWRDGREVDQRVGIRMAIVRSGSGLLITRLVNKVRN